MNRDNPYRPSSSPVAREDGGDFIRRPYGLLALSVTATVVMAGVSILVPSVLGRFRELFAGFGAELPPLTQVALGGSWVWWVLALASASITTWIARTAQATRDTYRRMKIASVLFVLLCGGMLFFFVIALYQPIFRLGAVV
jgi:FtsH-binding integral membrane protein